MELIFTLVGGALCHGYPPSITYAITCDEDVREDPLFVLDMGDLCNPVVKFAHQSGCPSQDFSAYLASIEENLYLVGAILIVLGLIIALKGRELTL
mmetsp:Transcript_17873/g.12834  ORF Transcript_17873/g.12834 Transcript_17873/m.12834 type:complete len:96 (-) Transcript_17873:594-881(-)